MPVMMMMMMMMMQAGDGDTDDEEDVEEEETALESYETPLDKDDCPVDEYQVFKSVLESKRLLCLCTLIAVLFAPLICVLFLLA